MIRDKLCTKPGHPGIIASIFTLLCMLQSFARPLYGDVDNYFIALVANKMFAGDAQDGYILHLHPILCKILECVQALLKTVDCVALVSMLMLLLAIWTTVYIIAKCVRNYYELIVYVLVMLSVILVNDLFHDNYTRWAAFMTAAGMLLLLWCVHKKCCENKYRIITVILLACGMMWRDEAFWVFGPFVALDLLVIVFLKTRKEERYEEVRTLVKIIIAPVACAVFLCLTDGAVRQTEGYHAAILYDDARVAIVDYSMKSWDEVNDQLEGISRNDYESARRWILSDVERIDVEYLQYLGDVGHKKDFELSLQGLIGMQKRVLSVFIDSPHFRYLGPLMGMLFLLGMCMHFPIYNKVQMVLLFLGTDLIFLYLAYVGRAIERGYIPAIYALLSSLAILFLLENQGEKSRFLSGGIVVIFAVLCIGREVLLGNWELGQNLFISKTETGNKYDAWCENDELYIWNAGSYMNGPVQSFAELGKLVPGEVLEHHLIEGAWIYGQVYFQQYLEKIDVANPMEALVERDNTFYVAEDCTYVLRYLQEHFDEKLFATHVGEIDGTSVWEFAIEN